MRVTIENNMNGKTLKSINSWEIVLNCQEDYAKMLKI